MGITFTVIATQARDIQSLRVDEGLDGSEGRTETLQTSSAALDWGTCTIKLHLSAFTEASQLQLRYRQQVITTDTLKALPNHSIKKNSMKASE